LSAAYGISQARGWVALLGERLKRERPDYIVVNASISGETTGGGLARIKPALERHRPAIVILELGANDGLRGLPVAQMKKNLGAMIEQAQKAFGDLAKRYQSALVPFFLEDVVKKPDLFQPDRIHPTAEAQPLILERVWTRLRPLLKSP
jgi:acyl-CoA thioesterase-1